MSNSIVIMLVGCVSSGQLHASITLCCMTRCITLVTNPHIHCVPRALIPLCCMTRCITLVVVFLNVFYCVVLFLVTLGGIYIYIYIYIYSGASNDRMCSLTDTMCSLGESGASHERRAPENTSPRHSDLLRRVLSTVYSQQSIHLKVLGH